MHVLCLGDSISRKALSFLNKSKYKVPGRVNEIIDRLKAPTKSNKMARSSTKMAPRMQMMYRKSVIE